MRVHYCFIVVVCLALLGCKAEPPPQEVVARVNDYSITRDDFESGFAQSAYYGRGDQVAARREYLDNLINQKLILQDAQKKNIDKEKDFLKSIEHFWEQSLLTVSLGLKAKEISASIKVSEDKVRSLYEQMVKDGITTKPYEEVYPQIKWQAAKQIETQALSQWMDDLKKSAVIKVNEGLLKDIK